MSSLPDWVETDECEHTTLDLSPHGDHYYCVECEEEFVLPNKTSNTEGVGGTTNTPSGNTERGDNMSFDTSSLPSTNTVPREEAGAWIARQAEEQGIGNSFKVYYNDAIMGKLEDLPEQVNLENLRVSAALDQAQNESVWFTYEHVSYAYDSLV